MKITLPELEITHKLCEISRVMSDGYHFLNIRALVEEWETKALAGDRNAQEMIKVIETFYRLCVVVSETQTKINIGKNQNENYS